MNICIMCNNMEELVDYLFFRIGKLLWSCGILSSLCLGFLGIASISERFDDDVVLLKKLSNIKWEWVKGLL